VSRGSVQEPPVSVRNLASLSIAILLGLIALVLMRSYLVSHGARAAVVEQATSPVVVAAGPIGRGAALKPEMLKIANYPRESVPQGAFTKIELAMRSPDGSPRNALRDLVVNEPIVASKLSGPDSHPNLSGVLAPGMRAVSVKSGDVVSVGGFALPGDRVDVLVTRTIGTGDKTHSVLQVLAENVRVMGVDQSSDADKPIVSKAVTIEVTPQQAQAIALAQAVGEVTLALRQAEDTGPLQRRAMTVADLGPVGGQPPVRRVVKAAAKREVPVVRVTRGVEVANYVTFN